MTSVEKKSNITAIIGLGFFVLAFILGCIFIKQPPKVVYKTIQIQLASTPVKKTQEQVKSQAKQPVKKTEKKETSQPKKTEPVKTQNNNSKTETKSAAKTNTKTESSGPKIKKSVEELMAEQNAPKTHKTEWDDSMFDDVPEVQSDKGAVKKAVSSSSISGTAATVNGQTSSAASSSSSKSSDNSSSASSSTAQALSNMSETVYQTSVADGIKSRTDIVSDSTSGKVTIKMTDGRARQLISPSKPTIYIDEDNAKLLDTSRTVTITFTVNADGSVPLGEILISPSSILPLDIQTEIKEQIATWKFTSDPSGSKGTASFKYTLEIK